MLRLSALLLGTLLAAAGCAGVPARAPADNATATDTGLPAKAEQPLLLVSIDGFRNDYLERGLTPTLDALARDGVRAAYMRPSYPSITFPNHYTLVTGLRPDRHGVIANFMTDPTLPGVRFSMFDPATVGDARWWNDGTPLWTRVRMQGGRAAAMFWVGSEAPVHGARPEFWRPFDIKVSSAERVAQVLEWLALPAAERPHFTTLYFDRVDSMGHAHGPDSPELDQALVEVDQALDQLMRGIDALGLARQVNLVVVSDHGMIATGPEKEVFLDDLVDVGRLDFTWTGAYAAFNALPGGEAAARQLLGRHAHMQCLPREQIPARFDYGHHRRVPAYICIGEPGWQITTRDAMQRKGHRLLGEHGYDNLLPEMRAPFIAHGPAFRRGVVIPPIDNVDVYPLLARVLGIDAGDHDGDPAQTEAALRP
ncbi:ectonucleotide pyrophosphatase/phosphodiesterase [Stenotrophomonas mori]|uniref:Ectonucleotide pyrophosphatase/phosphodiesterase n=1 Tax=Stenotrophomonas mori TaxID=2871096 RepID=A0ABT0SD95_9GAMM|nr:ectonucleotide pyrophosphatase/phosphodiesterase [Stenotrophomonas mori]MCL7713283.1 ectonucleotide pyrophosphatase/phosphodiesterase [Stenotrophomonas mori]